MDYQELIERLRYERDDGSRNEAANAIESLLAENGRLKSESDEWEANSNQWEQEYYKKDAELAKYRDAPVVAWCHYDHAEKTADYLQHFKDTYASIPLIVKSGEEK